MNIGDKVIMSDTYYVSEKNKNKIFTVRSKPFDVCGTKCVWLEGYNCGYAVDGLTKVEE